MLQSINYNSGKDAQIITEKNMHDYRVVMLSTDPYSEFQFVIYPRAATEREAVDQANQQYSPHFEVDRFAVTEIVN